MNPYTPTSRCIIKRAKVKERILKLAREKQESHTRELSEAYQLIFLHKLCRSEGSGMIRFKVLRGKTLRPRILYPARLSFRIEGEIKASQTSKN